MSQGDVTGLRRGTMPRLSGPGENTPRGDCLGCAREDFRTGARWDIGEILAHQSDLEVLTTLIGFATTKREARRLAAVLLDELSGLPQVLAADLATLKRLMLPGRALELFGVFRSVMVRALHRSVEARPLLSGTTSLLDYLHVSLAHLQREQFRVLFLDSRNFLIRDEVLSEGTVNQTAVHVREVVARALALNATAMILVHNHPCGDPTPSRDDISLTRQINDVTRALGICVRDHLIIGRNGHRSLRSLELMV